MTTMKINLKSKDTSNHRSQPDQQPDAGDRSEETRAPRKRSAFTADAGGSPIPSSDVGVANRSPEDAPSSDATATTIASIVKSACQTMQLTEEQQGELRQCLSVLLNHDSAPLDRGYALLAIIEQKLMPSWPDVVENNWPLFQLSQTDVRELVRLARQDRDQNGRNPSFVGGDVRVSAPSTNKELPASPPPSANLDDGGPDVAQGAAPEEKQSPMVAEPKVTAGAVPPVDEQAQGPTPAQEKKRTRTKFPKAAETAASQAGEPLEDLVLPPVEATQPGPAEPAPSPPGTFEQPAPVDTAPSAAKPESERQVGVGQAPVQSMAEVAEPLTAGNAGRLRQLEAVIVTFVTATFEAGRAIREIRATKLYLEHFDTFEEYCEVRLCFNRSRGYQLIDAADVKDNLSTQVDTDTSKLTEKHCRELVRLKKPADQRRAWKEAADSADGNVSLVHLKQVVAKLLPPAQPMPPDKGPTTSSLTVEVAEATPDHAVPAETHEEPTTDLPESPPSTAPAPCDSDEFDLDAEWQLAEETLNRLLRRCPRGKRSVLWHRLNDFFEQHPDFRPDDETP